MPATLKVKNKTTAEIAIDTPTGTRRLAANAVADFTGAELRSPGFTKAHDAGSLAFVKIDEPNAESVGLARSVLPPLITAATTRLADLRGRYAQARTELLKLREAYNRTRKSAEISLDEGKKQADQVTELKNAAQNLVLETQADDPAVILQKAAVKAAVKAIDALKNEDLSVTARTREAWFAERLDREAELQEAQATLAHLSESKADPMVNTLGKQVDTLIADAAELQGINKDLALGAELPPLA